MEQRRFVSMADPHAAGLETVLRAENWSGSLTVRSGLEGRILNAGVARYSQFDEHHLVDVNAKAVDHETIALGARTSQSGVWVAEAARTRIMRAGKPANPERRVIDEPGFIAHELTVDVEAFEPIAIEKVVILFTSRDRSISEPLVDCLLYTSPSPR